jgi:large repetitive protein
LTGLGRLYSWDNSSNAAWGIPPIMTNGGLSTNIDPRDFDNNVNNIQSTHYKIDDNWTYFDSFHFIDQKGYYAGNPNPTRANPSLAANRFNGLSPVPDGFDWGFNHGTNTPTGVENNFKHPGRPGVTAQNTSLFGVMGSTNGICEYRASNFNNQMRGNVLGASFNGILYRVAIDPLTGRLNNAVPHNGSGVNGVIHLADGFGNWNILDVCSQADNEIFPGTIWVAEYGQNAITILEPQDFNQCNYSNPNSNLTADFDGDGYTNGDEIANSTDPCSPASKPRDWDNDKVSDLNDTDDDNDTILDINDAFALDKDNGTKTNIPVNYEWEASSPNAGYILNSGFTGLMINNAANYRNQYDEDEMTVIGTAGFFTIDNFTNGTAELTANNQDYAFQFGVNTGVYPGKFQLHTAVIQPFGGFAIGDLSNQSHGVFLGRGDQKNYLKLVADANGGLGGLRVVYENNDVIQHNTLYAELILGKETVHLYLIIEPATQKVQPAYSIDNEPLITLGSPITIPANWLNGVMATGIISSTNGGSAMNGTWGFFKVEPILSTSEAVFTINSGNNLESTTSTDNSFKIANNSPDGQKITKVIIDLSSAIFPDMVFDPNNAIQDLATAKAFTINAGESATGFVSANYVNPHGGNIANGYNKLEINFSDFDNGEVLEFSIDTDPTSIKGITATHTAGNVSGLELAGATVTTVFDDGSGHIAQLYRKNSENGTSENILNQSRPAGVSINMMGINPVPAELTNPSQTVQISGLPNAEVKVLVLEGGLFVNGVPAGGYDIDAYEANKLLKIVQETTVSLNNEGLANVNILLSRTDDANAIATGLNHIVVVAKNSAGQYSLFSNVIKLKLKSGPPIASYRVNAGGVAYTTTEGAPFTADAHFTGGNVFNPQNGLISNTEDDILYQSERYGNSTYNFNVANGNYQVILHFAEVWFGVSGRGGTNTGAGSRIFNVKIENNQVLTNYDVFAKAGAPLAAIQESFYVNVTDGQLNVQFINVKDNAKISAIEIIPFNGNTPPVLVTTIADQVVPVDIPLTNPFNFSFATTAFSDLQDSELIYTATLDNDQPLPDWIQFNPATRTFTGHGSQYQVNPNFILIKVTASDSQGLTASDVFKLTVLDPIEYGTKRINAAGNQFVSASGAVFSADNYFTGGNIYTNNALEIQNTTDDVLYRSERWGNTMAYNIPVSNGGYKVTLHFAEIYFGVTGGGGVGSRRFNVDIEGSRKLSNFTQYRLQQCSI